MGCEPRPAEAAWSVGKTGKRNIGIRIRIISHGRLNNEQ